MSRWTDFRDTITGAASSVWSVAVNPIIGQFTWGWDQLVGLLTPDFPMPDLPAAPEVENRSPNYGWRGKNTTAADAPVFVVLGVPRVYGALVYQGADSEVEHSSGAIDYVDPATTAEFLVAWGEGEVTGLFGATADDVPLEDLPRSTWRHYLGTDTQQPDPRFTTLRRYQQLTSPTLWEHADGDVGVPYPDLAASFTPAGDNATVRAHLRVQVQSGQVGSVVVQVYYTPNGGSEVTGAEYLVQVAADQYGYVDVELPVGDTAGLLWQMPDGTLWDSANERVVLNNQQDPTGLYDYSSGAPLYQFAGGVAHQVRVELTGLTPTEASGRTGGTVAVVALVVEERLRAQALRRTTYSALTLARADLANNLPKLAARVAGPAWPVWDGAGFASRFTNNPIWCLRGLLTDARFGANLATAQIHDGASDTEWGGWRRAAAYCDAVVSTLDTATGVSAAPVTLYARLLRGSPAWSGGTLYQWRDGAPTGASATVSLYWVSRHAVPLRLARATLSAVAGSPTYRPGDTWSTEPTTWKSYLAADTVQATTAAYPAYPYTGITDAAADYTGYLLDDGTEQLLCLYHDRARGLLLTETAFATPPTSLSVREQRFRLDLVLDRRRSAEDWLRQILSHCRGLWWEDAGTLRVAVPEAATEVGAVGPAAMLAGSFHAWEEAAADLPDAIRARYWEPDQSFQRREVTVGEPVDGGRIEDVEYPGVLNPRQAQRLAWTAYRLGTLTWRCSFATPLSTLAYEPGDVLTVSHPLGGSGWGYDVSDPDAPVPVPVEDLLPTDLTTWTNWATVGVTDHGDGSYTIEDNDAALAEYMVRGNTIADSSAAYVARARFLKDADQARYPALYLNCYNGTTPVRSMCQINTATGAIQQEAAYPSGECTVTDLGTYWELTTIVRNNASGNTALAVHLYPARGASGSGLGFATVTATGTTRVAGVAAGPAGKAMRVLSVGDGGDGDSRTYTCREVHAAAYADDPGYNLPDDVRDTRPLPGAPAPAENVVLTFLGDNLATDEWDPQVQLEWTHPVPGVVAGARVYESTDGNSWREVGYAGGAWRFRWLAPLNTSGTLYARAVPVSVTGVAGSLDAAASASASFDTTDTPAAGADVTQAAIDNTVTSSGGVATQTGTDLATKGIRLKAASLGVAVPSATDFESDGQAHGYTWVNHTATWQASTAYSNRGHFILPTTPNGAIYVVHTPGTSGATEPTWTTGYTDLVTDGSVTWLCIGAYSGAQWAECYTLGLDGSDTDNILIGAGRNPLVPDNNGRAALTTISGNSVAGWGVHARSHTGYGAYAGSTHDSGLYGYGGHHGAELACATPASGGQGQLRLEPAAAGAPTHTAEAGTFYLNAAGDLFLNTDGSANWKWMATDLLPSHPIGESIVAHGADPTGVADSRAAVLAAIAASISAGHGIVWSPRGKYKVSATIVITDRHVRITGPAGVRNDATHNGAQFIFAGTGPCLRLGTPDASDWDAGLYNGVQGLTIEGIHLTTASQDTALANGLASYQAGTTAIEDWRGGHVHLTDVWCEKFEHGFWGVNSDINTFSRTRFLYNKVGLYLGPRSDQFAGRSLYTIGNDTAVWIDGRVSQANFLCCQFVEDGSSSTPPIKIGSWSGDPSTGGRPWDIGWFGINFVDCWFERMGINTATINAFIEVGAGDTVGGTNLHIERPHILAVSSGNGITYFLVRADGADHIKVTDPQGVYAHNLARLVAAFGSGSPHFHVEADHTWAVGQTDGGMDTGASTGSPTFTGQFGGLNATWLASGSGRTVLDAHPYSATKRLYLSTEVADQFTVIAPNYSAGQTNRLLLRRVLDVGTRTAAPTTGTWERGDIVLSQTPAAGGSIGWVCVTGGTPGTWKTWGAIAA